jgi:hypothetical protein
VVTCAPRIPDSLIEALVRLDDERVPIAELNRRVGAEAARLGLTRPSYQRIRELVHESRRLRRRRPRNTLRVLWKVYTRELPPLAIADLLYDEAGQPRGP